MSELNRQETELLEARALPLRNYLMKYVMPSLTDAILDCCKIKVEDPVDFLVPTQQTFSLSSITFFGELKLTQFCLFAG